MGQLSVLLMSLRKIECHMFFGGVDGMAIFLYDSPNCRIFGNFMENAAGDFCKNPSVYIAK